MGLRIGDVVDEKFRIVGRLGEGGMGTVYEAVHLMIHRRVAIKVLKAGHAGDQHRTCATLAIAFCNQQHGF